MKKILAVLSIFAVFSTSAMAFEMYLGGALGIFKPNATFEDSIGGNHLEMDYKLSYSGAVDLHVYFNDYVGIHGTVNGMYQETDSVTILTDEYKIKSVSVMLGVGLAGKIPLGEVVEIYGNAGPAWVYSSMDMDVNGSASYDDLDSPSTLGFYGDLGVRFLPLPTLYVGANVRYIYAKKDITTPNDYKIGNYDLGGFAFMANIGVKF